MKTIQYLFIILGLVFWLSACNSASNDESTEPPTNEEAVDEAAETVEEEAAENESVTEEPVTEQRGIIGSWSTEETISGSSYMFNDDGTYEGYDGKNQFGGNWEFDGETLTLDANTFPASLDGDVLVIDGMTYTRDDI